jgi:probable HAF family extracellular repeat protein
MHYRCFHALGALALVVLAAAPAGAQIAPRYRLVPLGVLGREELPARVNERGDVVGTFYSTVDSNFFHGFLYRDGRMTQLVPGLFSQAVGVNESGTVAGFGGTGSGYRGWVISGGVRTDIPPLSPDGSYTAGINDAGDVVGYGLVRSSARAFLFRGGETIDLGLPAGADASYAKGINNRGEIIGIAYTGGTNLGVVYRDGDWSYLVPDQVGGAYPVSINDAGEIVGTVSWGNRAARFRDGVTTLLGPANVESVASDVNNQGLAVGSYGTLLNRRAFVDDGTRFVDLNTLLTPGTGWVVHHASGINDAGNIVGYGRFRGGPRRAYMLVPVPEPAGVTVPAGAALLFPRRRRRSVQNSRL